MHAGSAYVASVVDRFLHAAPLFIAALIVAVLFVLLSATARSAGERAVRHPELRFLVHEILVHEILVRLISAEKSCALTLQKAVLRAIGDDLRDGAPFENQHAFDAWLRSVHNARSMVSGQSHPRIVMAEVASLAQLLGVRAKGVLRWG